MSVEVGLAAIGSLVLALWGAWRAHTRAVITAEQRGRLDEIERQRQIAEGVRLTREAGERALREAGEASARAAESSPSSGAVTAAEADEWAAAPKGR